MRRASRLVAVVVAALFAALPSGGARATTYAPQITNGEDAEAGAWPFMVGLLTTGVSDRFAAQFCGGSLIDASWVLTAAHCVVHGDHALYAGDLDVLVGSVDLRRNDGERVVVAEILAHPGYVASSQSNDIALLRLASPVALETIRHAVVSDAAIEGAGVLATLLGWGGLTPDALDPDEPVTQAFAVVLQEATFPVIDDVECAAEIGGEFDSATMLCAGDPDPLGVDGVDACYGDSGGPLFAVDGNGDEVQIGIVSFGPGCAYHPTAYTQVSAYREWIDEHVREVVDHGPLPNDVRRTSGANRYATAAALALERWDAPVDAVYVVTGEAFPDALAVAPLASSAGSPVLLTQATRLPDETREALLSLTPATVVVTGGTAAVSPAVEAEVRAITGANVVRVAGADRYATAVDIAGRVAGLGLPEGFHGLFLASGTSFADALGGAAAAATHGVPLLLTSPTSLPAITAAEVRRLAPGTVYVLGGPAAVSDGVVADVAALGVSVVRLAGANRFETAAQIATSIFEGSSEVMVATGLGFPDGLVAGALGLPLLLVPAPDDVPSAVADAIGTLGAEVITIMGGTGAVSDTQAHGLGAARQ